MNKRCGFGIAALLLGSSLLRGQAVRTFVSTTGSDTNPCAKTTPCRNFNAAIAAVDSGSEVVAIDSGGFGAVWTQAQPAATTMASTLWAMMP